jgi:hypothetical protein
MSDGFVQAENRLRTAEYRKDEVLEDAIETINSVLEREEPDVPDGVVAQPTLFVFGLPRSGTTLLHQVLAWGLDVGYVSNVMARFYRAPYAGAMLSQAVLGARRDDSFASDYGKSLDAAGGHEFAYFWQRALGIGGVDDLVDFGGVAPKADWPATVAAVRRMQWAFGRPMLFKTNFAAQFLPQFASELAPAVFVLIERDPRDVALSILEARRRYYGDTRTWWATYPPNFAELRGLDPVSQVAGQVVALGAAYEEQVAKVPSGVTVRVAFDELCADPDAVVRRVRQSSLEVFGQAPELLHELPPRFEARRRAARTDEDRALLAALEELTR